MSSKIVQLRIKRLKIFKDNEYAKQNKLNQYEEDQREYDDSYEEKRKLLQTNRDSPNRYFSAQIEWIQKWTVRECFFGEITFLIRTIVGSERKWEIKIPEFILTTPIREIYFKLMNFLAEKVHLYSVYDITSSLSDLEPS